MANKPGGGIQSKNVRNVRAPKTEPVSKRADPAAVSQLGEALAFKPAPIFVGHGYAEPQAPTSSMGQGPGANRVLYGQSGTQGVHGPVAGQRPPEKGKDILGAFGSDKKIG
jgi:hypothetical protein